MHVRVGTLWEDTATRSVGTASSISCACGSRGEAKEGADE